MVEGLGHQEKSNFLNRGVDKLEYKEALKEYATINSSIKNRIVTLSLTVIASIFVLIDKNLGVAENIGLYKMAYVGYIVSFFCEFFNTIFASFHYQHNIDGKFTDINFRKTWEGKLAECFFWGMAIAFAFASIVFVFSVLRLTIQP